MHIQIDEHVASTLAIVALQFQGLEARRESQRLWSEIDHYCSKLRGKYSEVVEAKADLNPARSLYHAVGIDPTKNRPSSEALFRRVVVGKSLYRINSIVDVCNLCSLVFLLPIGLYDCEKIQGNVRIRLGCEGEGYEGINKGWVNIAGRFTLADDLGPFGNPSSDSARTKISLNTNQVYFVIFAPHEYPAARLQNYAKYAENKMIAHNDGILKSVVYHPHGF